MFLIVNSSPADPQPYTDLRREVGGHLQVWRPGCGPVSERNIDMLWKGFQRPKRLEFERVVVRGAGAVDQEPGAVGQDELEFFARRGQLELHVNQRRTDIDRQTFTSPHFGAGRGGGHSGRATRARRPPPPPASASAPSRILKWSTDGPRALRKSRPASKWCRGRIGIWQTNVAAIGMRKLHYREQRCFRFRIPRSSNGRTAAFGAVNRGSNPCRGATLLASIS